MFTWNIFCLIYCIRLADGWESDSYWKWCKNVDKNSRGMVQNNIITNNLLSTVLTTISSGAYWLTSNLSFRLLSFPSLWMRGEFRSSYQVRSSAGGPALWARSELVFDEVVVLKSIKVLLDEWHINKKIFLKWTRVGWMRSW